MRTRCLALGILLVAFAFGASGSDESATSLDFRADGAWREAAVRAAAPDLDPWTRPREGLVVAGAVDGLFPTGSDTPGTIVMLTPGRGLVEKEPSTHGLIILVGDNAGNGRVWSLPDHSDGLPLGTVSDPDGRQFLVVRVDRLQMGHAATDALVLALDAGSEQARLVARFNDVRGHGCGLPGVPQQVEAHVLELEWSGDGVEAGRTVYTAPCGPRAEPARADFRPAAPAR